MKTFRDIYEDGKPNPMAQRRARSRRMSKMAASPSFQMKKKRALLKVRDTAKLTVIASKKAIQIIRNKVAPGYKDMDMAQRIKVDQKIRQKFGPRIQKIAKKLLLKLRKQETERVKIARAGVVAKAQADA